jgi:hypothetical protein
MELSRIYEQVNDERAELLQVALDDATRCCPNPAHIPDPCKSEQHWIDCFRSSPISTASAYSFVKYFDLERNNDVWDGVKIASAIEEIRRASKFLPLKHISELAEALGAASNGLYQISAATKMSVFLNPSTEVFITDSCVRESLRKRLPKHAVGRRTLAGKYGIYELHSKKCTLVITAEEQNSDFRKYADLFRSYIYDVKGPMANSTYVPVDFLQRRFLDKFMFKEGQKIMSLKPKKQK